MSVRKSIILLYAALEFVGGAIRRSRCRRRLRGPQRRSPRTISDLSNVRAAVAGAKALVDKGDLAAARTRLKDLDKLWDGAGASSSPQTVARWRVIERAIDRGLDRALLALRPRWPNAAMGDKALADLVAAVDQVSGKNQAGADGGRS